MDTKGVLQQIREHLVQGKSSQEVIALGYAPGSVYKIQRHLRRSSGEKEQASVRTTPEASVSVLDAEAMARMEQLETENAQLRTLMAELRQEIERATSLQYQLQQRFEGLITKARQPQEQISRHVQEQQHRIEALEQQVQRLDEVVCLLGLLVYHLDMHHRQQIHRWPPDPADRDL
jgi:predicted RNase H-like nuclease (RuvC/YqgF family)